MCYKKPGPRCSAWAKKRLDELEGERVPLSDPESYDKHKNAIMTAQLDCDATPGGQKYLRARISQGDRDGVYAERLKNGILLRQMQLEAARAVESGDLMDHEHESPFHTTFEFPESFEDERRGWGSNDEKEKVEAYLRASDNAMMHLTPEEQSGLWWITSDGGPFLNSKLADNSGIRDKWNMPSSPVTHRKGYDSEFVEEKRKALDSAFAKYRLSSPASLYRGLADWSLPAELGNDRLPKDQHKDLTLEYLHERYPVGETVEVGEYMSTTADPGKAIDFTGWRNQVILEIQSSAAIPVGRLSTWKSKEREYVVNRSGQYRVEGIHPNVTYVKESRSGREQRDNVTVVRLVEVLDVE